jgi:hypothetical protein
LVSGNLVEAFGTDDGGVAIRWAGGAWYHLAAADVGLLAEVIFGAVGGADIRPTGLSQADGESKGDDEVGYLLAMKMPYA